LMHGCPRGAPSALLHEPLRHKLAETILRAMLLAPDFPQGPRFGLGRCREASLAAEGRPSDSGTESSDES